MKEYTLFEDPGHAWLEVPYADLVLVGVEHEISSYSYYDPIMDRVYLEEDLDKWTFLDSYKFKYGKKPNIVRSYLPSRNFIRDGRLRWYSPKSVMK